MEANQGAKITWLGHATVKIETVSGKTILIDPWLEGNPATPQDQKKIEQLDLMLITHAHGDHMGDAVSIARQTKPEVVTIFDFCEYLQSKGIENCTGINKGGTIEWNGIHVTMVDAIHSSGFMEEGVFIGGGSPAGFILRLENDFTIYHSGDTDLFESMRLIGRLHHPDLAMLPIGDHFTMGPRQAAEAIRMLGVQRVLPIHWGTFPLLTGTPEQLEVEARDISGLRIIVLKPGETVYQSQVM
jgi:L-ascorbate metabolism protein UlaG (beta-lactamase superfamily)